MGNQVLLLQLDGKIPNLALMRVAHHHRQRGDSVVLRLAGNVAAVQPRLDEPVPDRIYASLIFTRTRPLAHVVAQAYPGALIGGTGIDPAVRLDSVGIDDDGPVDYSDFPRWRQSIGFTQRGCRLPVSVLRSPVKGGRDPTEPDDRGNMAG